MSESPGFPAVAIVGMSCRFPGAPDPDAYWALLREGRESIHRFSRDELLAAGVPAGELDAPGYVPARGVLDAVEYFDAAFFGLTPREASLLDPQHRLWLECAWEALEEAGCNAAAADRAIGVFAGCRMSSYLLTNLVRDRRGLAELASGNDPEAYRILLGNDKDMLAARTSYVLNLRGPSITVQTACSSSLVAVAQACQSLVSHQCDVALAGGVSIALPLGRGYRHQPDGILSPDGHCRAFDVRAQGTVMSDGVGAVALKRLDDAIAGGEAIHAVIRGWAVNNDGGAKQSFTAPAIAGQEEVIALAQAVAGVDPRTIGYVEAHGTGTTLGDPIEVAALTRAFRRGTADSGFCALGSVKTNIGHTDAASGIAGLIKAALALREGAIPPSLHFDQPNPAIDFANGPFFVARELASWPKGAAPRRAGVTALGIGGTNCHVVLEEPPTRGHRDGRRPLRAWQRQRCWVDAPGTALVDRDRDFDDAPRNALLGRRLWLPMSREIRFESRLSCAAVPHLGDHRLFGSVVVAAATDIALILSAVATAFRAPGCVLEDLAFLRPLVIAENRSRLVQLVLAPGDDDWHSIHLLSRDDETPPPRGQDWTLHLTGRLTLRADAPAAFDLAARRATCREATSGDAFYERLWGPGADTGPAFRWLRDLWRGGNEAVAAAAPPDPPAPPGEDSSGYPLAPGLIEACFQTLFHGGRFETREATAAGFTYVPVRIARFALHRRPGAPPLWCHGAADREFPANAPLKSGAARLIDAEGSVVAEIEGFELRQLARGALDGDSGDADRLLYAVDWVPLRLAPPVAAPSRRWLIDADDEAAARLLADRLARRGSAAAIAAASSIGGAASAASPTPSGIVWLRGFKAGAGIAAGDRLADVERSCIDLLGVAQALATTPGERRLYIVTSGAQATNGDNPPTNPQLAALWGLGRVLAREMPALGCTCIDADGAPADFDALVDELLADCAEPEVVLRDRRRVCARLAPLRRATPARRAPLAIAADATYLVTDGLSAQGLAIAAWLVDRGARFVVLATAESAPSAEPLAALEGRGAALRICRHGTLASRDAARAVVEALAGMPPLRGVVALNDVMDDGVIVRQTPSRLEAALQPALRAWALDSALRAVDADFFVCFSASAAVLGDAGQGSYAAAGALLDALAHDRRRRGAHGLAIDWGPWADAGKAAELPARHRSALRARGWTPLPTETALRCLEALLHADAVQASVLPVDWHVYEASLPAPHPLLARLDFASDATTPAALDPGPARAHDADSLLAYVLARTAEVLGAEAGRVSRSHSIVDLGLDSLAALIMSNRFQQDLGIGVPMAAIIESRDLGTLATVLQSRMLARDAASLRNRRPWTGSADGVADVAD